MGRRAERRRRERQGEVKRDKERKEQNRRERKEERRREREGGRGMRVGKKERKRT